MTWIDISQPFTNDIGHWPGDTPFNYETTFTKEQTGSVNIGKITTSLHTGTHVDAPFHFNNDGKTIDQLPLDAFIGTAYVLDVSHVNEVRPEHLMNLNFEHFDQLLLKTALPNKPERFPEEIPELHPSLAPFLQEQGIKLLGVDLPSVDQTTSKELFTHHALHKHHIHILENVMLDHVEEGLYQLIALPLHLVGADGSPVRAVIKRVEEGKR